MGRRPVLVRLLVVQVHLADGAGPFLALQPHVDELGITLKAIGTPAEEHGGGKVLMLEQGAFDGVGLALMVHPVQDGLTYNPAGTSAQAVGRYKATFTGKAAHAAAAPLLGLNAADAAGYPATTRSSPSATGSTAASLPPF